MHLDDRSYKSCYFLTKTKQKQNIFTFPCHILTGKGHKVTSGVSKCSRSSPGDAQVKGHGYVRLRLAPLSYVIILR